MIEEFTIAAGSVSYQQKSINALLPIVDPEAEFPTIRQIFQKAIRSIQEISGVDTVAARIYDPKRKCFRLMACDGMTPEMVESLKCISGDLPIFSEIMTKKISAVETPVSFIQESGYKNTIIVPLIAEDRVVGSIDLYTDGKHLPTGHEFDCFTRFGRMLGPLIDQAQQTERLQTMAVIQERTRLSNELHDDVAQLVRSMKWGLDEARVALENNQLEQTGEILENLERIVQHTSSYLREEMLSLREDIALNQGIMPVLQGMLLRFERNWGIKTAIVTDHNAGIDQGVFISPEAETQLVRIIREALSNIRRHANARTVTIHISSDSAGRIVFTVIDDGIGFCVQDILPESLGLRIIHERASSVGATVRIDSVEGIGTILKIELPGYAGAVS